MAGASWILTTKLIDGPGGVEEFPSRRALEEHIKRTLAEAPEKFFGTSVLAKLLQEDFLKMFSAPNAVFDVVWARLVADAQDHGVALTYHLIVDTLRK